jgi:hypothetical protein
MNTDDDATTTWRDLADSLTPQQLAYIEGWDKHPELAPRADGPVKTDDEHQKTLVR